MEETVDGAVKHQVMRRRVKLAATDAPGFESRHVSVYYAQRKKQTTGNKGRKRRRFPKAGIVCDCQSHVIVAVVPGRGPMPEDKHFQPALKKATGKAKIDTLLADAGYDGERSHVHAREEHGMKTVIPPKRGRPTDKLPKGKWRKRMATDFDKKQFRQRWQVETVNRMIQRLLGSSLRSRKVRMQNREMIPRAIIHNVMILRMKVFYIAGLA